MFGSDIPMFVQNHCTLYSLKDILGVCRNCSVISMPYPLIDAMDSAARGDKERIHQFLGEIGTLLERNQGLFHHKTTSIMDQSEKSFLTQSRLTLGNMEEVIIFIKIQYILAILFVVLGLE